MNRLLFTLLATAGLLLPPSTALAATPVFKETFGSANQPTFSRPQGLAIDPDSGDLLVIHRDAGTVERYNPDGTPSEFSALGSNAIDGSETPQGVLTFGSPAKGQVAVDNSGGATDGDIYVTQASNKLIDVFDDDGSFLGQLTKFKVGPGAEGAEETFGETCGVGVDPAGNVYLGDFDPPGPSTGEIHKYEPSGDPVTNADNVANFPFAGACTLAMGDGPTAGFIFPAPFVGALAKLDSGSGAAQYPVDPDPTTTETVDPVTGHVYVATSGQVKEYDASGATEAKLLSSFSPGSFVRGVAVNASGEIYVSREGSANIEVWEPPPVVPEAISKPATPVEATSATLRGEVNPNELPLSGCFFEWGETAGYGEIAPCEDPDAEEVGEGNALVPVHAEIEGLKPGTVYHFRLVAENANGSDQGDDEALTTLGPIVSAGTVSQITASGARVGAQINPHGEATSFVVQYVTEARFEDTEYEEATVVPEPPRELPAGSEPVQVFQQLGGLDPDTTYRFRFVAVNGAATSEGPDGTFATFVAVGPLPDGRAYEMVSPPQKLGEVFAPEPNSSINGSCSECLPGINNNMMPMQSTPDGDAVAYVGQPFAEGLAAGPNEYLGRRGAGGWETEHLSEPLFDTNSGQGYQGFSEDLSRGVLYQVEPALSAEAPSSEGKAFANLYLREADGELSPLVAEQPPNRGPGFQAPGGNQFRILYGGANAGTALSPAFGHVTFEANDALTEEVPGIAPAAPEAVPGDECGSAGIECNLYEWVGGELRLVNVLPGNGTAAGDSAIGSGRLLVSSQFVAPNVDQAISSDGARIFWSSGETGQLYVRVNGEETLEVPGPGLCKESLEVDERVCFLTASADGTRVLLSDGQLYELDEGTGAYEPSSDLTEGLGGFQGILGASEDLSRVYFIDIEALTEEGEENPNGEHAEAGEFNLYAWSGGSPSFLGILSPVDNQLGSLGRYGAWRSSRPHRTAQVSPDGRFLAFMSRAPLTGFDNLGSDGSCGGEPCFEAFLYAADSEELSCASCNPSGQRPLGPSTLSLIAQGIPRFPPFPQPGNLSDEGEGRLFFESGDVLSSRDTNSRIVDIYQWEPEGVGDCERVDGCVSLISSGKSANDSMFLDSSANGDDAFFVTRERLLPRDQNDQLDLYVARAPHVPGEVVGFPEGGTVAPCGAEACKGPLSPVLPLGGVSSAEFTGPGNLTPRKPTRCAKGKVRRRGRCVARRNKAKQQRKHRRRAGYNRRAAR